MGDVQDCADIHVLSNSIQIMLVDSRGSKRERFIIKIVLYLNLDTD